MKMMPVRRLRGTGKMEGKLVGVHEVKAKLADGSTVTYYYAWRGKGAPRMTSKPGTKAFTAEFIRLTKHREKFTYQGTVGSLIADFRATAKYKKLAVTTRKDYERMKQETLHRVASTMKDAPRSADMHLGLLARVFAWAKDNEIILRNPLERVEHLHEGTRRDCVWTMDQINTVLTKAAPHIRNVACIALWTMQRQADILTMPMIAFDGQRVSIKQGKTGARVRITAAPAILPILQDAKDSGRQRVLVNSFGQNWTASGFKSSWRKEMARLKIKGVTFHDLRGTAITYAYAHLNRSHEDKVQLIAEISGHSREEAEGIIRRHYLAGQEVIDAISKGTR
ncbi:integrase [Agrobacterium salinitolerans]|uniref:Integrase n=1 Tax=Agrobacterium salinitolerans TaxID=1183413 RepID=A0A9X3KPD4_9HYPH|nr:integrase [Agrobacterium salinitolerans]MCZ7851187.1 integrase [Agrobacterium salinitolerans]MCZ7938480.1 integrase [Agrobacterium salinitolerans]